MDKIDELLNLPLNTDGEPYLCDIEKTLGIKWQADKGFIVKIDLVDVIRKMIKRIKWIK